MKRELENALKDLNEVEYKFGTIVNLLPPSFFASEILAPLNSIKVNLTRAKNYSPATSDTPHTIQLGVGDGSGNKFVYGDYDSIKTCQYKLLELEEVKKQLSDALQEIRNLNTEGENNK